jgi:hypothetical protein
LISKELVFFIKNIFLSRLSYLLTAGNATSTELWVLWRTPTKGRFKSSLLFIFPGLLFLRIWLYYPTSITGSTFDSRLLIFLSIDFQFVVMGSDSFFLILGLGIFLIRYDLSERKGFRSDYYSQGSSSSRYSLFFPFFILRISSNWYLWML